MGGWDDEDCGNLLGSLVLFFLLLPLLFNYYCLPVPSGVRPYVFLVALSVVVFLGVAVKVGGEGDATAEDGRAGTEDEGEAAAGTRCRSPPSSAATEELILEVEVKDRWIVEEEEKGEEREGNVTGGIP